MGRKKKNNGKKTKKQKTARVNPGTATFWLMKLELYYKDNGDLPKLEVGAFYRTEGLLHPNDNRPKDDTQHDNFKHTGNNSAGHPKI